MDPIAAALAVGSNVAAAAAEPKATRAMCYRCRRPISVCYCASLLRLDTTTRVVILQHPRERDMPIGTARMASLCLPQAELHVGVRWGASAPLARALSDPARPPILLYPGPGARDILRDPPAGPVTLVVVDGTWSQAKVVVRDNPVLHALPRYAFATPEPSQYRIRREPRAEYVSTIEALMHVLGVLEGEPARFRALLEPLSSMVDAQLACQAQAPQRLRHARRPRVKRVPRQDLPAALTTRFADLVCVATEANAWPYRKGVVNPGGELVHWVARRVASGESFDVMAAPASPLSPSTPFHAELDEAGLLGSGSLAELIERFAGFVRPTDVICAWGPSAPNLMSTSGGALPEEAVDLRAAAKLMTKRKLGGIESYAASLGAPPAPMGPGRAGRRLAMLVQVIEAWRQL